MGALTLAVVITACSESTTEPANEFIADSADFVGYRNWEQTSEPLSGPEP